MKVKSTQGGGQVPVVVGEDHVPGGGEGRGGEGRGGEGRGRGGEGGEGRGAMPCRQRH